MPRVKIEQAMYWGKGKDRKGYGAGSIIDDVPDDIVEKNPELMKITDEPAKAKAYNPDAPPKSDAEKEK